MGLGVNIPKRNTPFGLVKFATMGNTMTPFASIGAKLYTIPSLWLGDGIQYTLL
jgi:hypothetical protein